MSHIVTVETEVRDHAAVAAACRRLALAEPAQGTAHAGAMAVAVGSWATESLLAAQQAYQAPSTGQRIKSGTKLGDDYRARSLPVAKWRFYQAGVRLAMLLNEVYLEK